MVGGVNGGCKCYVTWEEWSVLIISVLLWGMKTENLRCQWKTMGGGKGKEMSVLYDREEYNFNISLCHRRATSKTRTGMRNGKQICSPLPFT